MINGQFSFEPADDLHFNLVPVFLSELESELWVPYYEEHGQEGSEQADGEGP